MPKRILPLLACLVVLLAACVPTSAASPPLAAAPANQAGVGAAAQEPTAAAGSALAERLSSADAVPQDAEAGEQFSAEHALAHVQALSRRIGSRPVGSSAADAARDYIAIELRRSGFDVETPSFPFRQTDDAGSRVLWSGGAVDAGLLAGSAVGAATGEIIPAGIGRSEELPVDRLAGNIALIERGTLTFREKVVNAERAGASAVIVYNNQPGGFRGNLSSSASIPTLSVSGEDGARLRRLAGDGGLRATVEAVQRTEEVTGYNVVGTLAGPSDRVIVIGGHFDSVSAGPGANDNASGIATALEIGRALALRKPAATIKVVAFGAEEVGLVGSRAYVAGLSDEARLQTVAMLNFDMVGVGDRPRVSGSVELAQRALRQARALGLDLEQFGGTPGTSSDHASFTSAGIPALFFTWLDDPNYHSPNDRAEYVGAAQIQAMGELGVRLAAELASAP